MNVDSCVYGMYSMLMGSPKSLVEVRDFFETVFKLETFNDPSQEGADGEALKMGADKVLATCVGIGYTNLAKRTT